MTFNTQKNIVIESLLRNFIQIIYIFYLVNDEVSTTEDLNCHQTSSNEEPTKKSSYIKNNNSSSKFYTRSTSVNNLKYSNFQSLANRAAAAKNQSNKNQFSSVQFNQIFDEHNTSPAAGTSLSSSSSDAIVSNLSISSLASPNQKNEHVDQSYKSGSSKLIIKVRLYILYYFLLRLFLFVKPLRGIGNFVKNFY